MIEFIPSLPILASFAIASLLLAITPGPDMTLFLGRALSQGRLAGVMSLLGATTGTLIHTTLAVAGISALLVASPTGFWLLKIAGAFYLLWLAYQSVFKSSTFNLEPVQSDESVSRAGLGKQMVRHYLVGIGVNLLNPKVVIFFMTFLPQFVTATDPFAPHKMMFLGLFFAVVSVPPMIALIFAANRFAASVNNNPSISRMIDYVFGAVFAAFAIRILTTSAR